MRGEEDMPMEPPCMWNRAVEAAASAATNGDFDISGAFNGGDLSTSFGGGDMNGGDVKCERSAVPAPRYNPDATVACYTSFESSHTAAQVVQRIGRALDRFHGAGWSCEDDKYKLKASVLTPVGNIVFTAQVFIDDRAVDAAPHAVIEFRRRTGDSLHYLNLYNELRDQLTDLVRVAPEPQV